MESLGFELQVDPGERPAGELLERDDLLDGDLDLAPPLPHLPLDQHHGLVGEQVAELLELVGEEGHRQAPLEVLQHEAAHEAAGVGAALDLHPVEAGHHAAEDDHALRGAVAQRGGGVADQPLQGLLVLGERVAGEEEAEGLLLVAQPLALGPRA